MHLFLLTTYQFVDLTIPKVFTASDGLFSLFLFSKIKGLLTGTDVSLGLN